MADCEADQLRAEVARLAQQVYFCFITFSFCIVQTQKFNIRTGMYRKISVLSKYGSSRSTEGCFDSDATPRSECRHCYCCCEMFLSKHWYCCSKCSYQTRCWTWARSCPSTSRPCSHWLSFLPALVFGWPSCSPLASGEIKSGKIQDLRFKTQDYKKYFFKEPFFYLHSPLERGEIKSGTLLCQSSRFKHTKDISSNLPKRKDQYINNKYCCE